MKLFTLLTFGLISLSALADNRQPAIDSLERILRTSKEDTMKAKLLNELSEQYFNMDIYGKSMDIALEAESLSLKLNFQSGISTSYLRLGSVYSAKGDYPKALEHFLKALKVYESTKNDNGIFLTNTSIGSIYFLQKDYSTALKYYFEGIDSKIGQGFAYGNIGMVYAEQQNHELALEYLTKALSYFNSVDDKNSTSSILGNIGAIHEGKGDYIKALKYYFEALEIKSLIDDKLGMCDILGSIGDIYYKQRDYKNALHYEDKSLELSKKIGYINSMAVTEEMISHIYTELGNSSQALQHYKQYIALKDSMFNEESTKRTVRAEMDFQFQKEQELIKMEQTKKDIITAQEKKRQRLIIYSVTGGLVLMLALALFIYRGYKHKLKANIIISKQKQIVDEKNRDILDSIRYAARIQQAILPPQNLIDEILPEHFIYFEPKDIVSGDFYFVDKINDTIFWASVDATGHSANGAMLSMLSLNILSGIVKEGEIVPSKILDKLNQRFNESLHKINDDSIRDGLDISFCSLDKENMILNYSGANNPLWIIRAGEILEYKADKMPIGQMYKSATYTNHQIQLQKGDSIYTFSDGICDLHSVENKKFLKKRLRELLLSIQDKSLKEQKVIISEALANFKGDAEQVDDMLIISIKI